MKTDRHVLGLDLLRFFAAGLVMLWHYTYWGWTGGVVEPPPRTIVPYPELAGFWFYGRVGVEIFFVISGFVIAASASQATTWSFARSRVLRLAPVLWICASLALGVRVISGEDLGGLVVPYLSSLFALPRGPYIDGVTWTLAVEVVFYSLVSLALLSGRFVDGRSICAGLMLWSGAFWIGFIVFHYFGGGARDLLSTYHWPATISLMKHGCFFAAGIGLRLVTRSAAGRLNAWLLASSLAVCVIAVDQTYRIRYESHVPLLVWALGVLFLYGSVVANSAILGRMSSETKNFLRTVGLMTYPVYLCHYVPGLALIGLLADLGLDRSVILPLVIVSVLIMSYVIVRVLEPSIKATLAGVFERIERVRAARSSVVRT